MEQHRLRGFPSSLELREPTDCSLRYSAALFAYIAVSPPTVGQGPVINVLSLPIFRHSFVGLTSHLKGWRKRGATHTVILKLFKKYPTWYDQVTDIFATQTARRINLIYKL